MLRVDLLPKVIVQGRRNVKASVFCLIAIVLAGIVMVLALQQVKNNIARTEEKLADAKQRADAVRKIKKEAEAKQGELDPIQAKIDFVDNADASGEQFFDRFWKINEYIYAQAQMSSFQITAPSTVAFTVQVADITEAGRFVLNLIQCPHITGIQVSGMPAGETVEPDSAATAATPTITREEVITFNVSATLTDPIETPEPPSAGGGDAAGGGMPGGPEGMMPMGPEGPDMPPPPPA